MWFLILLIVLAYTGILGTLLYVLLVLLLVSLLLGLLQDIVVFHPVYFYTGHGYPPLLPAHLDGGTVLLIIILVLVLCRRR
jgi:hypothetical protein